MLEWRICLAIAGDGELTSGAVGEGVFGWIIGEERVFGCVEGDVDLHEDEEEEGASHCAEDELGGDEWRLCWRVFAGYA